MENETIETITTTLSESTEDLSNQVEKYSDLINTYGSAVVIMAVIIVLFVVGTLFFLKTMSKQNNQLMKQQDDLLKYVVANKKDNEEKEKNIVNEFFKNNEPIEEALYEIKSKTNCDRAAVYVFHNGMVSTHGVPFVKTTCICEVIKKNSGVARKAMTQANMGLFGFDKSVRDVYTEGSIIITDHELIETKYPVIFNLLDNSNIRAGVGISICDTQNNMVAIVVAEYRDKQEQEILNNTKIVLDEASKQISPIVECYNAQLSIGR